MQTVKSTKRNYVGIACTGHDNAIAIVDSSGEICFAEAAERYLQVKRALGYSAEDWYRSVDLVLEHTEPDAELVIALTWTQDGIGQTDREQLGAIESFEEDLQRSQAASRRTDNIRQLLTFASLMGATIADHGQLLANRLKFIRGQGTRPAIRRYPHHLTHAAMHPVRRIPMTARMHAIMSLRRVQAASVLLRTIDRISGLPSQQKARSQTQ